MTVCSAFSLCIAVAVLAGCASKPDPNSFGGRLLLEGGDVAAIGEKWNDAQEQIADGRELIEDGNDDIQSRKKLVKKGENRIEDGEDKIARGERMIADGERATREAEQAYNARITVPSLTN